MKFKVTTTGYFYSSTNNSEHIDKLKALGFKFKPYNQPDRLMKYYDLTIDETHKVELEFNSLEDLVRLSNEVRSIVLDGEEITIYDDYME